MAAKDTPGGTKLPADSGAANFSFMAWARTPNVWGAPAAAAAHWVTSTNL